MLEPAHANVRDDEAFAWVRCYQELGERLPLSCRGRSLQVSITPGETLEALLARLKLPLGEVDLALINGRSAEFSDRLRTGDRVSLYPVFETLDITSLSRLRHVPLRRLCFVADTGLEELTTRLREAGMDARQARGLSRSERARMSRNKGYILLTRDSELIRSFGLERAHLLHHVHPVDQLRELLWRFDLSPGSQNPGPRK